MTYSTQTLWLIIILMGVGTFSMRYSFIYLFGKMTITPALERTLRFVPHAVLSALVVPAIIYADHASEFTWHNDKLPAGVIAAVVSYKTGNMLLTILSGMAALWLLKWFA